MLKQAYMMNAIRYDADNLNLPYTSRLDVRINNGIGKQNARIKGALNFYVKIILSPMNRIFRMINFSYGRFNSLFLLTRSQVAHLTTHTAKESPQVIAKYSFFKSYHLGRSLHKMRIMFYPFLKLSSPSPKKRSSFILQITNTMNIFPRAISAFIFLPLLTVLTLHAQTPGMIIKPASGAGSAVMDPNGDGYISTKTGGVQLGFTNPPNDDVLQSEIPFRDMVKPDPVGDLLRGPVGAFSEIVGVDAAGSNAMLNYSDGTNVFYRFRIDGYAPNSKSYSILIDTDGKFGFTGTNADPNAVVGNPGFEAEVVLLTNFRVEAWNVDGVSSGSLVASYSWNTNCQQSIAVTRASGDPDYFFDFYLPLNALTSLFTAVTPMRYVILTTMNPHPAIGNNALSDVGGNTSGSADASFTTIINNQTPTVPGGAVLERSICPAINAVSPSSTTITGTSSEASGTTINVYVYQSDGITLIGSGTTVTSGSAWTINVSSLSPSVTIANGQKIKATAKAVGEGTSYDNCNIRTVIGCANATATTGLTITKISGNKGYRITNSFPSGTIINWYNADYTLAVYPDKNGSVVNIPNPFITTGASQLIEFSTQTGQTFPEGVYYFTFQEPGKCTSSYVQDCQYSNAGTSVPPTITTFPITTATTSVSGTCGSSAATNINLFINGISVKNTTVLYGTSWTISGLNLTTSSCDTIMVTSGDAGYCPSPSSIIQVTRQATQPTLVSTGCSTSAVTFIKGNSNEDDGSTVSLYTPNTSGTLLGTATVTAGEWTVTGLNLTAGTIVVARVTAGPCVSSGITSVPLTITTQTNVSSYTIAITAPTEIQTSVSGTISGGTLPALLKLYIDQTYIGETTVAGGAWTVSGILSTDIYASGRLNVTLTAASTCESELSTEYAIVRCINPTPPTYTGGTIQYCVGGSESVSITNTQPLTVYQFVDSSGLAVGPSAMGNGGTITLSSNALFTDVSPVYVKAFKLMNSSCAVTDTTKIYFESTKPTATITLTNTSLSLTQSVSASSVNLPFSAKSSSPDADNYTITYSIAAKNAGFTNISLTAIPAAPGNISLPVSANTPTGTYSGTIIVSSNTGGVCIRSYDFKITVYATNAIPVISSQPSNATICSGTTTLLTVSAVNALSYQWQSATAAYSGPYSNVSGGSGATTATYTTPALTSKTYYRVIVTNTNGNVTSDAITVFVNPTPTAGAISGTATICAGSTNTYSITAIPNTTSYSWSYSGTGVTLTQTDNIVSIAFGQLATSGNLEVRGTNSCGTGAASILAITVNPKPFISNMTQNTCNTTAFSVIPANTTNGVVPSGTTYSWSAPTMSGNVTGGAAGIASASITGTLTNNTSTIQTATYTVTPVKGSCTGSTFTVIISVNPTITITPTATNLKCNGVASGSINIAVTGGTPGYLFAWSKLNGYNSTSQNISSLDTGMYTLTVTDNRSCTKTSSTTLTQPDTIAITPTITNVLCNGNSTGAISLSVIGGTSSYTYLWADGSASQNRTSLIAGSYTVIVTDANGCKDTAIQTLTQPSAISASALGSAIACYGGSSTITVTASGGNGSLTYSLNSGSYQAENTFSSQAASVTPYVVTVKDGNNCTSTTSTSITQPALLNLGTSVVSETCTGNNDGQINLTISGGTSAFTYDWSDVSGTSNSEDRTELAAGSYSVTVTDANGCTALKTITISASNPSPVTPTSISK